MVEDLTKMCCRCFRVLSDEEATYGFKIKDKLGQEMTLTGHMSCIEDIVETLNQLYGDDKNDSKA
jgi:hypothetical protein